MTARSIISRLASAGLRATCKITLYDEEGAFVKSSVAHKEIVDNATNADTFRDWLCGESQATAFGGPCHREFYINSAVRVIQDDSEAAVDINTPDLLALALGITPFPAVRIAAMDELRRRYLEDMA